jgi:hypothetical protein
MNAGLYHLLVRGIAETAKSAWVDVVSHRGRIQHGKFRLTSQNTQRDTVIVDALVSLFYPVEDIEIRVFVGAEDCVTLFAYALQPLS